MQDRSYDVILWGATGFTGRLVLEYLLKHYGSTRELRWAIAGRNQAKLQDIRQQLKAPGLQIILADSQDKPSLDAMVCQTRVICSTVGPYALYGSALVEACVENETDYCDLTGEVQWIRKMLDTHHEHARKRGVKIVHCCGFDSIPSDFGVYFLQKEAQARFGQYCQHIKMRVKGAKGGFSGGTYASLSNVLAEAEQDSAIYDILQNPYSLNPPGERSGPDGLDLNKAVFDEDLNKWISPFVMAAINTKIVRRSHALSGYLYGKEFQYEEATLHGKGIKARSIANLSAGIGGLLSRATPNSLIKKTADRFLPKPGEGPSKETRENGYFNLLFLGKLKDGQHIQAKVTGDKDPGYGSTSKMLAESAVCLAVDREKLPDMNGVLTPTTAMGDVLLERLVAYAGLTFEIKG